MTLKVLRRTLEIGFAGALLTLAGCASAPVSEPAPAAWRSVPIQPVTMVADPDTGRLPGSATAATVSAANDAIQQTGISPQLHPADYSDLFDRMRAGFKLVDSDHSAIDR